MKSYFGGKNGNGTYQTIINEIPRHQHYVELFLGSGAIIKNKKPAHTNTGLEINPAVIAEYHYESSKAYKVMNRCAIKFLQQNTFSKDTFIYVDPPYLLDTRKSDHRYKHELTKDQHVKILQILSSITAMVCISAYDNPLYNKMLKGWRTKKFMNTTRRGLVEETLYMNYPAPVELHDYSFLGNDFTDRQRIKRKIYRHVQGLKRLPVLERNAILADILKANVSMLDRV